MTEHAIPYEKLYSAFFRGSHEETRDGKKYLVPDGLMIRVEANSMEEAARVAEGSRAAYSIPAELSLDVLVRGYGSPSML